MKIHLLLTACLCCLMLLSGCATNHRKDVRPGLDGLHRVIIPTDDIAEASREAVIQAENYCQEITKSAYFFNDDSKMKTANRTTNNTMTSGKTELTEDGADSTGKKYTVDMMFKCL